MQLVKQNGGEARFIQCDVTQAAQVAALVQETVKAYGRLDCAFNNAGIEGAFAATADCTEENWDRVVAVDLKGVWLCMKYEIQQMLTQGKGAIVNTASVAGMVAERGRPAYAAAKGGVIQLSRTAAIEYASTGIRINIVCPGGVETPMIDRALNDMNIEGFAPNPKRSKWAARFTNWMLHSRPVQKRMMNFMHPIGRHGPAGRNCRSGRVVVLRRVVVRHRAQPRRRRRHDRRVSLKTCQVGQMIVEVHVDHAAHLTGLVEQP